MEVSVEEGDFLSPKAHCTSKVGPPGVASCSSTFFLEAYSKYCVNVFCEVKVLSILMSHSSYLSSPQPVIPFLLETSAQWIYIPFLFLLLSLPPSLFFSSLKREGEDKEERKEKEREGRHPQWLPASDQVDDTFLISSYMKPRMCGPIVQGHWGTPREPSVP